jgi:hypothetical protein
MNYKKIAALTLCFAFFSNAGAAEHAIGSLEAELAALSFDSGAILMTMSLPKGLKPIAMFQYLQGTEAFERAGAAENSMIDLQYWFVISRQLDLLSKRNTDSLSKIRQFKDCTEEFPQKALLGDSENYSLGHLVSEMLKAKPHRHSEASKSLSPVARMQKIATNHTCMRHFIHFALQHPAVIERKTKIQQKMEQSRK